MPELTIDGQKIEVEPGTTILEAAEELGKDIPVFCYHAGLSPDGNCRMCIVEVEDAPKMPPSCTTECQDDMVVHTENENVKEARESVLEFLLLNHPLDCPICDKSGECMLQDHYFDYSAEKSRMEDPKVTKRKVVDVGPDIVLDTERCILCTRCIRFVEEVSEEPSLGIVNRGDHAEITTFPGKELDDPYSLNTVDICPVGALTSKHFRFKKRVWFLEETESVCPNCARGCSMEINHESGTIYRFMPRYNPNVNDHWLCDEGRLEYEWVMSDNRLETPLESRDDGFDERTWSDAETDLIPELRELLESDQAHTAGLLSIRLSNEENYAFTKVLRTAFPDADLSYLTSKKGWLKELTEDDILREADKNPNRKGVEMIGETEGITNFEDWVAKLSEESPDLLLTLEPLLMDRLEEHEERMKTILRNTDLVVCIGTHRNISHELVDWMLPGLTWAEKNGTFTNADGQVQVFKKAFDGPGNSRSQLEILNWLSRQLVLEVDRDLNTTDPESVFRQWAENVAGMEWDVSDLGRRGKNISGEENVDESPDVNILETAETEHSSEAETS